MADSFSSPGTDVPSPTLSARLREVADFLAAPMTGRLTEEQRALALGIARRLVADAARTTDEGVDVAALWNDWLDGGLPTAARLAAACFARAEEHRWREHSAARTVPPSIAEDDANRAGDSAAAARAAEPRPEVDRAYLVLQIADRRRFDDHGNPCIALADVDAELFRALLLDIAAWRTMQPGAPVASPDEVARRATEWLEGSFGIDQAAAAYHAALDGPADVAGAARAAIVRHDWPALIALAAAGNRRSYADMALALLSAEAAALPNLLAPLRLDRASLAPLEASLAALPGRAGEGG